MSTKPPQPSSPPPNPQASEEPTYEGFASILGAALNKGKTPAAAAETPAAEAAPAEKPKPKVKLAVKNLTELADALNVEVSDLYGLEIPSAREGEKPFTLGGLKDHAAERDTYEVEKLQESERQRMRQSEFNRAERELADILQALPPQALKPEFREALQERRNRAMVRERQLALDTIPGWRDEAVRTREIASMIEHLKDHGFPDGFLGSVHDHLTLRYIRDNWERETQVRKALERVAERKPTTAPKSKPAPAKPSAPKVNGLGTREQAEAARMFSHLKL